MSKLSRSENRTKWFSIVADYEQSELNKEEFCLQRHIKKTTLDYWIRKNRIQQSEIELNSPFAKVVPATPSIEEIRVHLNGIDVFLPLSLPPVQLKILIHSLIH